MSQAVRMWCCGNSPAEMMECKSGPTLEKRHNYAVKKKKHTLTVVQHFMNTIHDCNILLRSRTATALGGGVRAWPYGWPLNDCGRVKPEHCVSVILYLKKYPQLSNSSLAADPLETRVPMRQDACKMKSAALRQTQSDCVGQRASYGGHAMRCL